MILIKEPRENLLKPLQTVTGIVEKRQTFPILSNVLIQKDNDAISFLTSDTEMQIETTFNIQETEEDQNFSLTVSAKKLQDILRSLTEDAEVTCLKKDERLLVKSGKSQFSLQILPSKDFPTITEDNEPIITVSIQQKNLKNLLGKVQYAIAEQDIRYFLNGVLLSISHDKLIAVGTDTHRLAFALIEIQSVNNEQSVILPRKTVYELIKLLNNDEAPVTIEIFPKRVKFSFSNIILISKIIDGKYPNYDRVIPTQNDKFFDLERLSFLQALQRVSILSNSNELLRGVRLAISEKNLNITCKNNDQEEAIDEIVIQYNGDAINYSLNITYLIDLLNHVQAETFRFAFSDTSSSVLITIPDRDDFKYIVMPMRI